MASQTKKNSICKLDYYNGYASILLLLLLGLTFCWFNQTPTMTKRVGHMKLEDKSKESEVVSLPTMCTSKFQPHVLVYNRIGKTGSSTMWALIDVLSEKNNFKVIHPTPYHDPHHARDSISKALLDGNHRYIIMEHLNFPAYHVDQRVAYMNIVRRPWDRLVSLYCYSRYGPRGKADMVEVLQQWGNKTVDECVAMPKVDQAKCMNFGASQTSYFCGPEDGVCANFSTSEQIAPALANIKKHYVVGLTEQYQATVEMLAARFPAFFKGAPELYASMKPKKITTAAGPAKSCKSTNATSEQAMMTQSKELQIDQSLYDEVASHFWGCHKVLVSKPTVAKRALK